MARAVEDQGSMMEIPWGDFRPRNVGQRCIFQMRTGTFVPLRQIQPAMYSRNVKVMESLKYAAREVFWEFEADRAWKWNIVSISRHSLARKC